MTEKTHMYQDDGLGIDDVYALNYVLTTVRGSHPVAMYRQTDFDDMVEA